MTQSSPALNLILDSGAYSVWRSNMTIDLDAYCRFIKENEQWVSSCVALDVINPSAPEEAAAAGMANYKRMLKQGIKPIPVFHIGEDVRWLKEMLDLGAEYIGLASGIKSKSVTDHWYDLIWDHITTSDGSPVVKVHAFGLGRKGPMTRFPWASADTASWIYTAQRTATIRVEGKHVSHRTDGASKRSAQDVDALEGDDLVVWKALMQRHGLQSLSRDKGGNLVRSYLTAKHYLDLETEINEMMPIRHRSAGIICQGWPCAKPIKLDRFNLHLVIGNNAIAAVSAYMAGIRNMLVSYAHLGDMRKGKLPYLPEFDLFATDPEAAMMRKPYVDSYLPLKAQLSGNANAA